MLTSNPYLLSCHSLARRVAEQMLIESERVSFYSLSNFVHVLSLSPKPDSKEPHS